MGIKLLPAQKLVFIAGLTLLFCGAEIGVGLYSRSLALIADAFHYLFDFGSYLIAYIALRLSHKTDSPKRLTFGWARAQLLGSFVNGVTLTALGFSILIQSLQRFVHLEKVRHPMPMLIVGCFGLALNVVALAFFHHHPEEEFAETNPEIGLVHCNEETRSSSVDPTHAVTQAHCDDHGFRALFLHALGDLASNFGVVTAATIIWQVESPARFYADPALSMAIAVLIMAVAMPLIKRTGLVLMDCIPPGLCPDQLESEIRALPGVGEVHTLRVWQLNETETLASVHFVLSDATSGTAVRHAIRRCLKNHGIDSMTVEIRDEA